MHPLTHLGTGTWRQRYATYLYITAEIRYGTFAT